jgi:hypothetical protein
MEDVLENIMKQCFDFFLGVRSGVTGNTPQRCQILMFLGSSTSCAWQVPGTTPQQVNNRRNPTPNSN